MGEVFRAEDTKLGREVAVKVLPEAFVADPERLARFKREARVLASLAHPNIAAIHEVGEDGGTHFLVMELAAGETLAERLANGALPLDEALSVGLQIAEALEAAHERGIVHRDLKPANVIVDVEGRVKVLDFGLARAMEPEGGSESATRLTHSPTLTMGATQAGVLLGTAAYMSPEQAAGKPADRRADIWAFGVVLLEMLTGRVTFAGETVSHVLASVLKDEPEWEIIRRTAPPPIARLLERCLRKDPKRRLQAIGDARVVIEEVLAAPARRVAAPATAGLPLASRLRAALPGALLAVTLLALGAVLWMQGRPAAGPTADEPLRFALALPPGYHVALESQDDVVAISADGRRQALVVKDGSGARRLLLRDHHQAEGRLLPETDDASSPFFSPDGEWVAFFGGHQLLKVPVAGGAPVVIASLADDNRGATWSPDGTIYAAPSTTLGLHRVSEAGGAFEPVTQLDEERRERTHRWPHVLPDGSAVLFTSDTIDTTEYYDDARIEALRVATGERTVVLEQSSRARYMPSGHLVFARGGALYAVSFDARRLEVTGRPTVVLQGVATTVASGAAHFGVAAAGALLHVPGGYADPDPVPHWVDREGRGEPAGVPESSHAQLSLAPDGRRAAVVASVGQASDVWIADLARGTMSRLTFDGAWDPVWDPNGIWVYYARGGGGPGAGGGEIYRRRSDGSGAAELVWRGEGSVIPTSTPMSLSPDGRYLAVETSIHAGPGDIWILPLTEDAEPWPFVEGPFAAWMAEFSPDGRWLAYVSTESGRPEVYVRPFPGPGGRWQISVSAGLEPHWAPGGDELFYRTGNGVLFSVPIDASTGFVAGRPEQLFGGIRTGTNPRTYSVTPDSSRFLTLSFGQGGEVDRVHLTLGWDAEVARLTARRP